MIGEIVSHYKIEERLGGGGMGIVYRAKDLKLDRNVALKFLPPALSMDEDYKQIIINEAKIAATLDHPNICTIYEVGETEDEQIFIAMAYYEGETLKKKISNNSISENEIESIALQVAKGLEHAHKNSIIHRDIKPANIFITNQNEVKILDFGVAKLEGDYSVLDADKVKGTISYMSPEQISGKEIDYRTDIWAYGVLLYELAVGKKAFGGDIEQTAIYSILNDEPDYDEINQSTIPYLKSIIQKCLKKNKENRFQSIGDIFTTIINFQPQLNLNNIFFTKVKLRKVKVKSILLFVASLLIIFSLGYIFLYPTQIAMQDTDYVLISDFENKTGNEIFDFAITEAISISLRQSPYIKILPEGKIRNALNLLKLNSNSKINEEIAIKIAMRENTPFIISGGIENVGDKYVLSAGIIDVALAEKIKIYIEEIVNIEKIIDALDNLAIKLRDDLGESQNSIDKFNVSLAHVTTPSIDALDLYSRGTYYESIGKYSEAIILKEKALAYDSSFVIAISDLSYDHYKIGNLQKAIYYHSKVLPLVNRVSEREKLSILVVYYGPTFEMNFQKAYEYAQKWVMLYPKDALGYAQLGHFSMFAGDYHTAYEANKKAMGMESSYAGTLFNNTGFAYALEGNPDEAIKNFNRSKELRPEYVDIDIYLARAYWMKNQLDNAIQTLDTLLNKTSGFDKIKLLAVLSSIYYSYGQLESSRRLNSEGINLCSTLGQTDFKTYFHYLNSELALEMNNRIFYNNEILNVLKNCQPPYLELGLVGISLAKIGEVKKGKEVLERINNIQIYDPHFTKRKETYKNYIEGWIAHHEGNTKKAIEHLVMIEKLCTGDPIYLLAQKDIAYLTKYFDPKMSIQLYKELLDYKGEIFTGYLPSNRKSGSWIEKTWFEAHYDLGLLYLEIKDTNSARYYINKALAYWENASPQHQKHNSLLQMIKRL